MCDALRLAIEALPAGLGAGAAVSTGPSPPPASAASSTTTALVHEGELAAASAMMPINFSTFDNAAFCSDLGPQSRPDHTHRHTPKRDFVYRFRFKSQIISGYSISATPGACDVQITRFLHAVGYRVWK